MRISRFFSGLVRKSVPLFLLACIQSNLVHAQDANSCDKLRNLAIDQAFVTSANLIQAEEGLPAYCHVLATALPSISIDIRLPVDSWNGKYYQTGCGAGCGVLGRADANNQLFNAMSPGLKKGYATATSDSGHKSLNIFDLSWAHHNAEAERDWGYRSIGETHRVAQAVIGTFYSANPVQNYFQGCSTGGRMANIAALKYPEHFSGIISGAPPLDWAGILGVHAVWIVQSNTDSDGNQILKPGREVLIGKEVLAQCDSADGSEDGMISDPRKCSVDLSTIQCTAGDSEASCLSTAELAVVSKWRQGPQDDAGNQLYPGGIPEGSERFWWLWLTGNKDGGSGKLLPLLADEYLKYMGFMDDPGPSYSILNFDIEEDSSLLDEKNSTLYRADSTELKPFRDAGGKMIVWHGWADAMVTPYKTVEWFGKVSAAFGGEEKAQEFIQLFMIPGMDHCGVLPGENGLDQSSIDPLLALETWVEKGIKPESIMSKGFANYSLDRLPGAGMK
jgi:hypothetical protein